MKNFIEGVYDVLDLYEKRESKFWETNTPRKKSFLLCLIATYIVGLLAHGYGFTNALYSHDSLMYINTTSAWSGFINKGRWLQIPYGQLMHDNFSNIWLSGCLALLFLAISSWLIVEMLHIRNVGLIISLCGILCTALPVTLLTAVYNYALDLYMFALLLSVLTVFLWNAKSKPSFIFASIIFAMSIILYAPYIGMTVGLVMLVLLKDIVEGESFNEMIKKGLKGLGFGILGAIISLGSSLVICALTGISLSAGKNYSLTDIANYEGVSIVNLIEDIYVSIFTFFAEVTSYNTTFMVGSIFVLIMMMLVLGSFLIIKNVAEVRMRIVCILLILLFPLGIGIVYFISKGFFHELMIHPYYLIYIGIILCVSMTVKGLDNRKCKLNILPIIVSVLLLLTIYHNTVFANTMYQKEELRAYNTYSYMNRVLAQMEEMENYISGETPVLFVKEGYIDTGKIGDFEEYYSYVGVSSSLSVTYDSTIDAYFKYILNVPLKVADDDIREKILDSDEIENMPIFPQTGSVAYIEDVLVIKLN